MFEEKVVTGGTRAPEVGAPEVGAPDDDEVAEDRAVMVGDAAVMVELADRRACHLATSFAVAAAFVDPSARITWLSAPLERALGWRRDELLGRSLLDLVDPADADEARVAFDRLLPNGAPVSATVRVATASGQLRWFSLRLSKPEPVPATSGRDEVMVTMRDVHEERPEVVDLATRATRDALTGLGNRSGLRTYLDELKRSGSAVALAQCGLDGFRTINDLHGHAVGDEVLGEVAGRLATLVASAGRVFRLGSDQFVVVVPNVPAKAVEGIAAGLVDAVDEPLITTAGVFAVSVSVGIVFTALLNEIGTVVTAAHEAMWRAKERGGDRFELASL